MYKTRTKGVEFYESTTVYMYMSSTELNVPVISLVKFAFENYLRIHIDFQSIDFEMLLFNSLLLIYNNNIWEVDTLCNKLI